MLTRVSLAYASDTPTYSLYHAIWLSVHGRAAPSIGAIVQLMVLNRKTQGKGEGEKESLRYKEDRGEDKDEQEDDEDDEDDAEDG